MAFCEILSDKLVIKVNSKGAELTGMYLKGHQHNWIWSAEEPWRRSAPHLFPVVGKLSGDSYLYAGEEFTLTQHGFARDLEFEVVTHEPSRVHLRLLWSSQSKLAYPFDFSLNVFYRIEGSRLFVGYRVENQGDAEMLFNIGWHPAFVLPEQGNLPLILEMDQQVGRYHYLKQGLLDRQTYDEVVGRTLRIDSSTFSQDALVFIENAPATIQLSDFSKNKVVVNTGGAPFLGLWSKDPKKFVCIEPWWGVADTVGFAGDLHSKYGIQKIGPDEVWTTEMSVEIQPHAL